jgi:hypothetical protein
MEAARVPLSGRRTLRAVGPVLINLDGDLVIGLLVLADTVRGRNHVPLAIRVIVSVLLLAFAVGLSVLLIVLG